MPGPIIFGAIIDGTCKLWKYSCGERLSCLLYDIGKFRVAIISFGLVAKSLAFLMILSLYIYFRVTKRENWREDSKPMDKEFVINAQKAKENGVNMIFVEKKTVFQVSDQVLHKSGCTTTNDRWGLNILDL